MVENCTPKYSCRYVSPHRRRRLHLLALAFFLLFLSDDDDDDDDDAREIVIVEKEIGLRLASWELLRFQSGWWFWSLSGLYGSQQRISGERSASRGCRSWQSMWWKDQLERSVPWELHKQGWWSSRNKRTRAAATSLWTWNPWTTLLTMLLLPSRKNRTPPPHLCQSKRNFLFVSSAILVAIEYVTGGGSYNLVHFARLAKQQCALTICVLFLYLLLLQLGALSHMVGNSWSLLPYNSTTKKDWKNFAIEHLRSAMMDACIHAIILSGEKTELTCICVVAKKQSFRIGYYKQQSLRCVSL